jgi:hypothetical protein
MSLSSSLQLVHTTTSSTCCRVQLPSPSGRTATPSYRRTSWNARS